MKIFYRNFFGKVFFCGFVGCGRIGFNYGECKIFEIGEFLFYIEIGKM